MLTITSHQLDRLCPRPRTGAKAAIWDQYAFALDEAGPLLAAADIDTGLQLCHVLAQWAHETGGFTILWESGAYSADRIVEIFGRGKHSAAVSRAEAEAIAALPAANDARAKALFERVYGLGNPKMARTLGNTEPGDGYRFRGFGIEQITGRRDHMAKIQGDYSALGGLRAALAEWTEKGCNAAAARDDCLAVTELVNGGSNGYSARKMLLAQAKTIWLDGDDDANETEQKHRAASGSGVASAIKSVGIVKIATGAAGLLSLSSGDDPIGAVQASVEKAEAAVSLFGRVGALLDPLWPALASPAGMAFAALAVLGVAVYALGHLSHGAVQTNQEAMG